MSDHNRARTGRRAALVPPAPLDAAALDTLALAYAARFATTEARLRRYLARKLKERGWSGDAPPDLAALVARLAALRYVDDAGYAVMKARGLAARGLGGSRVRQALRAAGVDGDTAAAVLTEADPLAAAIAFARRRRLGPFATGPRDARKDLAAMARAGHPPDLARRVLAAADVDALDADQ